MFYVDKTELEYDKNFFRFNVIRCSFGFNWVILYDYRYVDISTN